jgi:excisionase family DNA binding protein
MAARSANAGDATALHGLAGGGDGGASELRSLAGELASLIGRETVRPLLDAREAAAVLNVPSSWIAAEARAGRIPHVRLGRYVRFDRDELIAWCEGRVRGPRRRRS